MFLTIFDVLIYDAMFHLIITFLLIYLIIKHNNLMATFAQFQEQLDRQNTAIENIVADIEVIKDQILESGMTSEQEDQLLALLQGVTDKVESLANENPETPEEPEIPEEEV